MLLACVVGVSTGILAFYLAYCIVGGIQLAGMIIHECTGAFTSRWGIRRIYHIVVLILVLCMALTPLLKVTGIVFFLLLYTAPLMAVFYTWLCFRETYQLMRRPLSILK